MLAADPLAVPLTRLNARTAKALGKLGLRTAGDLLRHYPRRYAEPGTLTDMAGLTVGEHVTIVAEVVRTSLRLTAQGRGLLQSTITDGHHRVELTFFASHVKKLEWRQSQLRPGRRGLFTGEVSAYRDSLQLMHPDLRLFGSDDDAHDEEEALLEAGRPVPVYPAVAGFESWKIAQAVRTVLDPLREVDVPDPVPDHLREREGLPTLLEALRLVHVPQDEADWRRGRDVARREARLRAELPTVTELLALAVSAGEGATGAIERVVRQTRGELSEELARTLAQARAGAPLTGALGSLADRTGLPALARLAEAVAVAVERGSPLGDVLRAQAQDVREEGRRALMQTGGRKEVLMMVPVVFLILPVTVLFAVFPSVVVLRVGL